MVRKESVGLIVILVVGIAVAPSIEANSSLIGVITDFYGLDTHKQPMVYLTLKQVEELEQFFYKSQNRLDNVTTNAEAEYIFKETIDELYKYNLLGDVNNDTVYKLVTGTDRDRSFFHKSNLLSIFTKNNDDLPDNKHCFIYGNSDNTMFSSLRQLITGNILLWIMIVITIYAELEGYSLSEFLDEHPFVSALLSLYLYTWGFTMTVKNYVNPFCLADFIGIGDEEEPANGKVFTFGAYGKKTWNETLYIDVLGFLGIKLVIDKEIDRFFYMGVASQVFAN